MRFSTRFLAPSLAAALALWAAVGPPVGAQAPAPAIRLALVSQWLLARYPSADALARELPPALDAGVADGVGFAWQRSVVPRSALLGKPIRVLPPGEAGPLGGRGEFTLVEVRPPAGAAAWTEVRVVPRSARPGDVLVLEVGGELNTVGQVLARLLLLPPDGRPEELPLVRRALFPSPGVPVLRLPFGRPVVPPPSVAFAGLGGVEFLVARSPIETVVDGTLTPSGPADLSPVQGGEWREGDRVLVRMPLAVLAGGAPGIVLAWKDRVAASDPDRRRPLDLFP